MSETRHNWTKEEILDIYNKPLMELLYDAATIHRKHHDPNTVQVSTLLSIKTGGCPEDCGYCPQAARYHTDIEGNDLMSVSHVKAQALRAKASGSSRVCMGAAWRNVKDGPEFDQVLEMVRTINKLDMEVCCTLGMLTENQAQRLAEAGLYAYNHNLDTSEDYYKDVISTRAFEDRLETIDNVRKSNVTVCSGGIIGMGEAIEDRAGMLVALASLNPQPESVPINALVAVEGTPMEDMEPVSIWDMIRMVATTRIVMPETQVRLSAGRTEMSREGQAMCFFAGANSIFAGDKLLTTPNPDVNEDMEMFKMLGLNPQKPFTKVSQPKTVEAAESKLKPLGEKPKWSRPGHTIERNEEAKAKSKVVD
ncbi:biotin synthase BioB [Zobellia galactanivorans]|uniref:Biotin synthase n=1 Tax=Zobellia galactanivorans (strain DSM 12802 / CCUG 47099 / CIP 106680 / NCIMB 13871 / Dsij) TaxID=63186 RepID=G0LAM6_ZOBGA|nr:MULTISPECIES: biotin synthase BioB [Zobellia]MDO6808373.1 biotin synthase BioB [Zobellia galactanivorans]OWW26488.1 biotin synthase BioB [Zobellia sp. OII3]CAZ95435.1 Biotin synthase [Zobellia galactanivorans]